MNKTEVIAQAVSAIPAWVAYLNEAHAQQEAMLAQITEDGPMVWLDADAPPPTNEAQQPPEAAVRPSDEVTENSPSAEEMAPDPFADEPSANADPFTDE